MIVMLSARRLKPGAWDQFRRAWDPGDAKPPGFQRAYHARNIRDEEIVDRCILALVNEGAHILEEGIAINIGTRNARLEPNGKMVLQPVTFPAQLGHRCSRTVTLLFGRTRMPRSCSRGCSEQPRSRSRSSCARCTRSPGSRTSSTPRSG